MNQNVGESVNGMALRTEHNHVKSVTKETTLKNIQDVVESHKSRNDTHQNQRRFVNSKNNE